MCFKVSLQQCHPRNKWLFNVENRKPNFSNRCYFPKMLNRFWTKMTKISTRSKSPASPSKFGKQLAQKWAGQAFYKCTFNFGGWKFSQSTEWVFTVRLATQNWVNPALYIIEISPTIWGTILYESPKFRSPRNRLRGSPKLDTPLNQAGKGSPQFWGHPSERIQTHQAVPAGKN